MNARAIVVAPVALATLALAGCEQQREDTGAEPAAPSSSSPSTADETAPEGSLPDGDYRKVVTLADARALGLRKTAKELELAPDGTQTITLRFRDGYWSHRANFLGQPPQIGAYGTVTHEAGAQAYVIAEPCCGTSRFTWELEGDRLEIEMDVDYLLEQNPEFRRNSEEVLEGKLAVTGTFRRVS